VASGDCRGIVRRKEDDTGSLPKLADELRLGKPANRSDVRFAERGGPDSAFSLPFHPFRLDIFLGGNGTELVRTAGGVVARCKSSSAAILVRRKNDQSDKLQHAGEELDHDRGEEWPERAKEYNVANLEQGSGCS